MLNQNKQDEIKAKAIAKHYCLNKKANALLKFSEYEKLEPLICTKEAFYYGVKFYAKDERLRKIAELKYPDLQVDPEVDKCDISDVLEKAAELEDLKVRATYDKNAQDDLKIRDIRDKKCIAYKNGEDINWDITEDDWNSIDTKFENDPSHGIYKIAKTQWDSMKAALDRAKNLMGQDFNYKVIGEDEISQQHIFDFMPPEKSKWFGGKIPVYIVEINCTVIENNWQVAGIVKYVPGQKGVMVTPINKDVVIPRKYYLSDSITCDHCHTTRDRVLGFIVYNLETKEFREVGKACLKEYTGINPAGLLALHNVYNIIHHPGIEPPMPRMKYFDLNMYLLVAIAVYEKRGYMKVGNALSNKEIAEVAFFRSMSRPPRDNAERELYNAAASIIRYIDENYDELKKKVEEVKEAVAKATINENDDFSRKIQVVLSGVSISREQFGIVCYLPAMYAKFTLAQEELKKDKNYDPSITIGKWPENNPNVNSSSGVENCWDWNSEITIDKSAIYKITISPNQTRFGSYPVSILVRGNNNDNNHCARIQTYVKSKFDTDRVVKITGIANGTNDYAGGSSGNLKNPVFWTEDMLSKSNAVEKYKIGERITFKVKSHKIGNVYDGQFGSYALITFVSEEGDTFTWYCSNYNIYTDKVPIDGETLSLTIKNINKDPMGNIMSYVGTRGKLK